MLFHSSLGITISERKLCPGTYLTETKGSVVLVMLRISDVSKMKLRVCPLVLSKEVKRGFKIALS